MDTKLTHIGKKKHTLTHPQKDIIETKVQFEYVFVSFDSHISLWPKPTTFLKKQRRLFKRRWTFTARGHQILLWLKPITLLKSQVSLFAADIYTFIYFGRKPQYFYATCPGKNLDNWSL